MARGEKAASLKLDVDAAFISLRADSITITIPAITGSALSGTYKLADLWSARGKTMGTLTDHEIIAAIRKTAIDKLLGDEAFDLA